MAAIDKRRTVIYITENNECAQLRYRIYNIIESLEKSVVWEAKCFSKNEISKIDLDRVNILVISRQTEKGNKILKLIKRAQKNGVKVLFDLDDLVFSYDDLRVLIESVQEKNLIYWLGYVWGIRRIAKRVDGFLATNDFLARKLKQVFKKPVKIIRNSLNQKQVEISKKILQKKELQKFMGEEFLIGYFSGSPTHKKDFQMVEPELISFLNTYENAKLKVVGYMEFSKQMKKMVDIGKVEIIAPVDYQKLQYLVSEVDVNIAPLVINDFTNCKSELKFFEAAIVKTTTIASPTYVFKCAIMDGKNGFLAKPGEWYGKLEYLYQHPKENQKIAKVARDYVLKHYYGGELLKEIEEAYGFFAK